MANAMVEAETADDPATATAWYSSKCLLASSITAHISILVPVKYRAVRVQQCSSQGSGLVGSEHPEYRTAGAQEASMEGLFCRARGMCHTARDNYPISGWS